MSVQLIVWRRRDALVRAWVRDPLIQVQVESPQALPRLVFITDPEPDASVGKLGRRRPDRVAVIKAPGDPDAQASVWVASEYGSYKAAYLAFLREIYQVSATPADLTGYDVDHLLNRARSPQDTTFIRIEAVRSDVNQAWGRLFEATASDPRFFANQARERRTMSYMICAKLGGQMPPLGPTDQPGLDRLVRYFVSIGLREAEARSGIESMLRFAYQRRS